MTVGTPIYPNNTRDSGATLKGRYDDIAGVHRRLSGPFAPYASNQFDFIPGDVSTANDTITRADHGLFDGDTVRVSTTGALPAGLAAATDYEVLSASANTFKLALDAGSPQTAVNITDTGSGIHTATRTANLKVAIAKGFIWNGSTLTEVVAQQTAALTAPAANPRIDRVVIVDSTGVLAVVTGAEAASPTAPAIPANRIPVCQIALTVGQTQIVNTDITDERALVTTPVFLAIASQAEAEAGADNTKGMTPLRTAQQVLANVFVFKTVAVSGQDDVVADGLADTLTLVAGTNITLTTSAAGDSVTITGTASGLAAASQAEEEAASSTTVATTPGRQHYHPGHPKCWIVWSGSAISESYNVTSASDNGSGVLTITIATDFSTALYCMAGMAGAGASGGGMVRQDSKAAGSAVVAALATDATPQDSITMVVMFGDQA